MDILSDDVLFEYTDYMRFAKKLNDLYELRRNATGEEAIKLDNEINELADANQKYFGLQFFNDLSKADPDTYNFLKNKYNIKLQRPETFFASLGKEETYEEEEEVETTYDLNEVGRADFDPATMNMEQEFERQMGFPFDPEKYEIKVGEGANGFDDQPYEELVFFEKTPRTVVEEETPVNPYENMTDEEINKRLGTLWNMAISSGEFEEDDKEVIEYHALLDELNRRRKVANPYVDMSNEDINKRLGELWNIAISSGELEDDDKEVIEYHALLDELNRRRKEEAIVKENKVEEETKTEVQEDKLEWDPRLTEEQILDAYSRDIYEPVGPEYEQFLREHGLDPIKKEVAPVVEPTEPEDTVVEKTEPTPVEPTKIVPGPTPVIPTPVRGIDKIEPVPPTPVKPDDTVTEIPTRKEQEVITLESVLYEITEDVDLSRWGRKQLVNSEIKVAKNFASKFKQNNNWIYNVMYTVPGLVGGLFSGVKKIAGGLYKLTHPGKAADLETVRERLRDLPKEKLEILRTEYDLGRANEDSGYNAIAPIIYERLIEYIETEYCQPRREELIELYKDVAEKYRGVETLLTRLEEAKTDKEVEKIERAITLLAKGSSEKIARIEELRNEISHYYNDGKGIQSLSTAYGAVDNNSNRRGRVFAKKYTTEQASEFNELLGKYSVRRATAVKNNNDLEALMAFGDEENHKIDNTVVRNSIYGKRSVGIYNYNPIPHQEEIGPDPLMSYVMRTIATIGIAKGIISEIQNQFVIAPQLRDANQAIHDHNADLVQVNQNNVTIMNKIHDIGQQLTNRGKDYKTGLEEMGREGILDKHAGNEYAGIGLDNGNFGTNYRAIDAVNHPETHNLMDGLNNTLSNINSGMITGKVSIADAISQLGQELQNIRAAKQAAYAQFDQVLKTSTMPNKFDYEAFDQYIPKIMSDSNSLANMVDGMVESVKAGETLQQAAFQLVTPLTATVPTHIQSFLIPIITQVAFLSYFENVTKQYLGLYKNEENIDEIVDLFQEGEVIRNARFNKTETKEEEVVKSR